MAEDRTTLSDEDITTTRPGETLSRSVTDADQDDQDTGDTGDADDADADADTDDPS